MAWNEPLWVRQFGTTTDDWFSGVPTDAAGNVYLTGLTFGSLGGADAWVAKLDTAGKLVWKRQMSTEVYDEAVGVATDAAGNVCIIGWTGGSLGGPNRGSTDEWVVKFNAAGKLVWKRHLGTKEFDVVKGVAIDAAGNGYIAGETWGSFGGPYRGYADAWVAKLDTAGKLVWKRQMSTEVYDQAVGVATDDMDNVYITGWTDGSLGGPNRGGHDAFVAKYATRR
jgi:hypothetical protein